MATAACIGGWLGGLRLLVLALFTLCLVGCGAPPDEEALRSNIAAMQAAVEQRSLAGVMDHITDDFGGSQGLDRDALKRLLQAQIIANANIGATIGPISIERQGERATATFSLVLTGGSGIFLPERGRVYQMKTGWRIEDDVWKVYFAEWDE